MRIRVRWLVSAVAVAAASLFCGAKIVRAGSPPVVLSATVGQDVASGRPVLTVMGKGLTKFKGFEFEGPGHSPWDGSVDTVVHKGSTLVLVLPRIAAGSPNGTYFLQAALKDGSTVEIPVPVLDASAPGTLNDLSNPVDWSQLKSVPEGFADGVDDSDHAWAVTDIGDVVRAMGRVGIQTTTPAADLHVSGNEGVVFDGTPGVGGMPVSGSGTRLVWSPGDGAFRAGGVVNDRWDPGRVGNYSVAMGLDTLASGSFSFAMGYGCVAQSGGAFAMGQNCNAQSEYSVALGNATYTYGSAATALGSTTTAGGPDSLATGTGTTAEGISSTSMGETTTAAAYASVVMGRFNVIAGNAMSVVDTDPVLVVGNGTSTTNRSNAFTLLRNGNLTIAGTLTQSSDLRAKKDVAPLTGVLDRLAGVRGVSYEFADTTRSPAGRQIGLVAQEVRDAFPELVREDPAGGLSVAYQNFTAVLLEAVKEQQATIEAKEREITAVREEVAATRKELEELRARVDELLRR